MKIRSEYRIHQIEETMDKDLKNVNVITDIVNSS